MTTTTDATAVTAANVASLFFQRVAASPEREAFGHLRDGQWRSASWRETAKTVQAMAAGLLALGILPEDRIAIASNTRYAWVLADLAVMCAAAATKTLYPSNNAADTGYIIADSGSRIVFAEDESQVAKLAAHRHDVPDVERIVVFDGPGDGDAVMTLATSQRSVDGISPRIRKRWPPKSPRSARTSWRPSSIPRERRVVPREFDSPIEPGFIRGRPSRRSTSWGRTICNCCGCRWRMRSARS